MLYGETELGGLHALYVLADSPELYGLPREPEFPVLATIQENTFRPYAWIAWGVVATALALNVLVARARQLRKKEEG
jgi:formate dehydrogenase iron-sulfur subunit